MAVNTLKKYSREEVAQHNTAKSCWFVIENKVYDVTKFLSSHPGGKRVLVKTAGKDATKKFHMFHKPSVLRDQASEFLIGEISQNAEKPRPQNDAFKPSVDFSKKNEIAKEKKIQDKKPIQLYPFEDPYWCEEFASPYYKKSHYEWRDTVRKFVEKRLTPNIKQWEGEYCIPREVFKEAGRAKLLAGVACHSWPRKYCGEPPVENYDSFHTLILIDEISRCGSGGVTWGLITGLMIGLPPILNFGSDYLKNKIAPGCLKGEKIICLCISEPSAASDVAGIETTAVKENGKYIVNGTKKWITNGTFADYFTVAVRTRDSKKNALSLLLIERNMPGVNFRHMKCQGVLSSGTAFVTFDNVQVPESNLIGKEGDGFKMIMHNFNHERWGIIIQANRLARVAFSDALKYALERKTFGKRLIEHQVIRFKLSDMARMIEATHAITEQVTFQWKEIERLGVEFHKNPKEFERWMRLLGDKIALLKVQSTKTLEFCAREALHVFGGSGYVKDGKGSRVEMIYRDAQAFSIPAGSEEIMTDYAGRMMIKRGTKVFSKN